MRTGEVQFECGRIRKPGSYGPKLLWSSAEDADNDRLSLEGGDLLDEVFGWVWKSHGIDESAVDRDEGRSVMTGDRFRADGFCHDTPCTEIEHSF